MFGERIHEKHEGRAPTPAPRLCPVRVYAYGRRGYAFAAANLAATIHHHNPAIRVEVYADPAAAKYVPEGYRVGNWVDFDPAPYFKAGKPDPGKLKATLAKVMKPGPAVVIDADMIALCDLAPWIRSLQDTGAEYLTEVLGNGSGVDPIPYTPWATPEQIRERYQVQGPATFWGVNTSWQYVDRRGYRKRPTILDEVAADYAAGKWTPADLLAGWGGSLPDELFTAARCTANGYDPTPPGGRAVFFGSELIPWAEIRSRYKLAALYGRGRGAAPHVKRPNLDLYDRYLAEVWRARGNVHCLKMDHVMRDKFTN